MSLPKHNNILKTPTKKKKKPKKIRNWKTKNPRSHHEIPKSKIGERERKIEERNLRSKIDNVLSRERESTFGTVGYDCLRVSTFVTVGYDFASGGHDCLRVTEFEFESEWVWEGGAKVLWVWEWVSLKFEDFVMSRLKVMCFVFWVMVRILSLIHSISTWLHMENLST